MGIIQDLITIPEGVGGVCFQEISAISREIGADSSMIEEDTYKIIGLRLTIIVPFNHNKLNLLATIV
jgi:hypothetical protein